MIVFVKLLWTSILAGSLRGIAVSRTLSELKNNCCPLALHMASGLSEAEVLLVCYKHGYTEKTGMYSGEWLRAAIELGLDPIRVDASRSGSSNPCHYFRYNATVGEFCKIHKNAVYLVQTRGHVFLVNRGIVIDPNIGRRGAKRRIVSAFRVKSQLPPHRPEIIPRDPLIKFVRRPVDARRSGTAGYRRYAAAYTQMEMHLSEAIRQSSDRYTRKDFRQDLRKGNVVIILG